MIIRTIMYTRLWPIGATILADQARMMGIVRNQVKFGENVDITEI